MRPYFIVLLFLSMTARPQSAPRDPWLFIGTYTHTGSHGIYVYTFDTHTGKATWVSNTDTSIASDPAYLEIASNGRFLYAVSEESPGRVAAYSFDQSTGQLHFLNKQLSGGDRPSYVAVTADNKWVAAANYNTGSVVVYGVNPDGSLKPDAQVVEHTGHGLLQRQAGPHAHSSVFSPQEDYLLVPDLGLDKIMIYPFNKQAASQPLGTATYAASAPGTGPRHLVFHPNKTWAYNMEEISGTVSFYRYDHGKLDFVQRIASHPEGYTGEIGSADIHLSPDGKFLYGSNRGDENTITIFAVDPGTGRLTVRGYQSTLGRKPRNFMIDPTGHFLLVANQDTDNIIVFARDAITGLLTPAGTELHIPNPSCLKMW